IQYWQFARISVGHCDSCCLGNGRVRYRNLFDQQRVNVVAATDDDILGAANELNLACGSDFTEIAGCNPAVDRSTVDACTCTVALEDVRPTHEDLATLLRLQRLIRRSDRHSRQRNRSSAARCMELPIDKLRRGDAGRLGHAVELVDRLAADFLQPTSELAWQR